MLKPPGNGSVDRDAVRQTSQIQRDSMRKREEDLQRRARSKQRRRFKDGRLTIADLKYGDRAANFVSEPGGLDVCRFCLAFSTEKTKNGSKCQLKLKSTCESCQQSMRVSHACR